MEKLNITKLDSNLFIEMIRAITEKSEKEIIENMIKNIRLYQLSRVNALWFYCCEIHIQDIVKDYLKKAIQNGKNRIKKIKISYDDISYQVFNDFDGFNEWDFI